MKLKDYLKSNKLTQKAFIERIDMAKGVKVPQSTLAKWVTGVRVPRKRDMEILHSVSSGDVQPNDFYNLEE
tara:strand:+ start:738 stop:950 length:213 start_codon:yes stop_codon:yes gene_type:complete